MEIISFTGKSGTGKSYQATRICVEKNIDGIIDDGLFIYKGKVMAGSSAKKCSTKTGAVKAALFTYEKDAEPVRKAIERCKPKRLMILGTSDKMVDWITESLHLHKPDERLYIEDYTTEEQRTIAYHSRHDEGNHVIPAPMGELKMAFSGYFINTLQHLRKLVNSSNKEYNEDRDITVVRPQFSYFGKFSISSRAIRDIVEIVADDFRDCIDIRKFHHSGREDRMNIDINVRMLYDDNVVGNCRAFQQCIDEAIEEITSFVVKKVNISITELCKSEAELHGGR